VGRNSSVGIASRYLMDGSGSTPGRDEIIRTRSDRPRSPPSLPYSAYTPFSRARRPGRGADHPPASSTEVKERVELYPFSTYGPSCPVLGWNLHFPLFGRGSVFEILPSGDKDWRDVSHVLIQKRVQILMVFSVIINKYINIYIFFLLLTSVRNWNVHLVNIRCKIGHKPFPAQFQRDFQLQIHKYGGFTRICTLSIR
jgi:hypothetical protein